MHLDFVAGSIVLVNVAIFELELGHIDLATSTRVRA